MSDQIYREGGTTRPLNIDTYNNMENGNLTNMHTWRGQPLRNFARMTDGALNDFTLAQADQNPLAWNANGWVIISSGGPGTLTLPSRIDLDATFGNAYPLIGDNGVSFHFITNKSGGSITLANNPDALVFFATSSTRSIGSNECIIVMRRSDSNGVYRHDIVSRSLV